MDSLFDRIKFDKWFHMIPLFALSVSFFIENSKLKIFTMLAGVVICFIGIRYKELKKK
ncbi:hypothetical protein [Clostridium gasigenes]|uniref:Uncharacterized protein n=1 Tax=Clostridium gasigenes TaxID=94869 RepID=A0A7X0VQL2_9CLOT|nr:hypothetical protein [Clostridium gasigenes]MBB6714404.1 hypothetical protein [Clostridium gasigenes]